MRTGSAEGAAREARIAVQRGAAVFFDRDVDAPEVNPEALHLIADACSRYPGRLDAFARIHPWYGETSVALLERAFTLGFKGLKLHPVSSIAHPAGEDTLRLIRVAAEHRAPKLFHCGAEPMATPLAVARAAEACPEATIILGHMAGYFHVDEAIAVAEQHENIVLETSAMPYPEKIRDAVTKIGPERVLYASDGHACSPRIEVEKVKLAGIERWILRSSAGARNDHDCHSNTGKTIATAAITLTFTAVVNGSVTPSVTSCLSAGNGTFSQPISRAWNANANAKAGTNANSDTKTR